MIFLLLGFVNLFISLTFELESDDSHNFFFMTFTGATSFATAIVSLLVKLRTLSVYGINLNLHAWGMLLFGCFFVHSLLLSWFLSSCVERDRERKRPK